MNRHKRLQTILQELEKRSTLEVMEVGEMLSISPATVRRDFNFLVDHYEVEKTWGGISRSSDFTNASTSLSWEQRRSKNYEAKKTIAKKAASLVKDGEIVFIDGGTTTVEMLPFLAHKRLRIITNSILIAEQVDTLKTSFISEVFLTGGLLYPKLGLVVGPQAVDCISGFNADWTFLSVGGISEMGATNSNVLVVQTERAMIEQSGKTAILADSSKFGKKDLVKLCDFEEVDYLITEDTKNMQHLHPLQDKKIEILLG